MKILPDAGKKKTKAFTLIELMTVVAIIAVLATIAFPGIQAAMIKAQMTRTMANAKSIGTSLIAFSHDHEGMFPAGENSYEEEITTSNDAFRSLFPHYLDSERIFSLQRSAYGPRADNRIDDAADILGEGENHYAYVAGLSNTSRTDWPLVVDATDGEGTYVTTLGSKGGAWEGRGAIMISVGGAGRIERLKGPREGPRFIAREGYPEENALAVSEYMGETIELLEPLPKN